MKREASRGARARDPGNWLSREELADYLGVSIRTVASWLADRRIPYSKIGRVVLINREAVDRELIRIQRNTFQSKR